MYSIDSPDRERVDEVEVAEAVLVLADAVEVAGVIHKRNIPLLVVIVSSDVHVD